MNRLVVVFYCGFVALNCATNVNANERYAYEYSSEQDDERYGRDRHGDNRRDNGYERSPSYTLPRYPRNYQQSPIQIYLSPNLNSYSHDKHHRSHPRDREYREDQRWRERREELQQMPQTPYFENQFERDDSHW